MRTIIIERRYSNEEIEIQVTKRDTDYQFLMERGMDVRELISKGKTQFISPIGVTYVVEFCAANTYLKVEGGNA